MGRSQDSDRERRCVVPSPCVAPLARLDLLVRRKSRSVSGFFAADTETGPSDEYDDSNSCNRSRENGETSPTGPHPQPLLSLSPQVLSAPALES